MTLRSPFPEWAWPALFAWLKHEIRSRVLDDYVPTDINAFVDMMRGANMRTWAAMDAAGDVVGFIAYQATNPRAGVCWFALRSHVMERAPGVLAAVLGEVFAGGVDRVAFLPFADQHSTHRLLTGIGCKREGVLRHSTMRGGKPADQLVMAILRGEVRPHADSIGGTDSVIRGVCTGELPGEPEKVSHVDQHEHAEV